MVEEKIHKQKKLGIFYAKHSKVKKIQKEMQNILTKGQRKRSPYLDTLQ
jgi:hypothetical protein